MPATDSPLDPRIQEFLDSFNEQVRSLTEAGDLDRRGAENLTTRYQTVARERHNEIVELIPQMGVSDAIFEAGKRYDADNVDNPHLRGLMAQFSDMRDQIVSGQEEIIQHMDRGLTAQDALYETEITRVGRDRSAGFREDVEAAFSAGLYETRIDAAIALDHARDAAWVRSLGNNARAAREDSPPDYVQDRQQDRRSDTPWGAPAQPPTYAPPQQPPAYQPDNANVARHAAGQGQNDQQSGNRSSLRRSARISSHGTAGAGTPQYDPQSSSASRSYRQAPSGQGRGR
ncbi:hypothetical protein [Streptomyces sp. NPDC006012]|uniref:hypothetical protein n=1 Tax=Streptomyces sp. NPDC006012 TaxID=3364739 RepID=UPI00368D4B00